MGGIGSMHFINAMLFIAMTVSSLFQESYTTEWSKKSTLSIDRQVEFPGIVLEPGIYVIRLKDGGERRSIVEIRNRDESQVLATVLAVPDHQQRPDDNSEFVYFTTANHSPQAVRTWFYSGDLIGLEFVYPKARAREIAKRSDDHVMASNSTRKDDVIVAVTPSGKEVVIDDPRPIQTARQKPAPK
jgi:hypothetical protein